MTETKKPKQVDLTGTFTMGRIMQLALPTIIMSLFGSIYGIVDGIFVANVGGNTAFAAVNLVVPIFYILASFGMMLGTGGNAIISKLRGEGKDEEANRVFSLLTYVTIIFGIILTIVFELILDKVLVAMGATENLLPLCMEYGRVLLPFVVCYLLQMYFQNILVTAGKGVLGLIFIVIGGLTNVVGDAIFVGVLANGDPAKAIAGASFATGLGLIVGGALPLIYFIKRNNSFFRLSKPAKSLKYVASTCSNGMSEFLTNISSSILNSVFNALLLLIIGELGVAAYGSISYINSIFTAIFMGFSIGVSPIIAYKYGAKDSAGQKSVYKNCMKLLIIISIVMVLIGEIFAYPLSAMFSKGNEALLAMTVVGFHIFAISFIFKGINTFGSSLFTALNNGLISGVLSVVRTLGLSIGAVLILPLTYYYLYGSDNAIYGIWWSVVYAEAIALIITMIVIKKNKKRYGY